MEVTQGSVWRSVDVPQFSPLEGTLEVDAAIVGGGITGTVAAYLLASAGKKVALLEGGELGGWATGSTTAFLVEYLDVAPPALIERFGKEAAARMVAAHREAIAWYEETIRKEGIECEFMRCDTRILARRAAEQEELRDIAEAAGKLGTGAHVESRSVLPGAVAEAVIERQAKFHPLRFLFALARLAEQRGARIFGNSKVISVREAGEGIELATEHGVVHARQLLMATQDPIDEQKKLQFKKAWYRTYVIAAEIDHGLLPEGLYEDLATPYHYLRVDAQGEKDRLIVGGEDHRADIPVEEGKPFAALEEYLKALLPGAAYRLTNRWKGGILEPGDGVAFIGPVGDGRVFYAAGYSGNGMTYGVVAARAFAAWCLSGERLSTDFAADRSVSAKQYLPKAIEYVREFFGGALRHFG